MSDGNRIGSPTGRGDFDGHTLARPRGILNVIRDGSTYLAVRPLATVNAQARGQEMKWGGVLFCKKVDLSPTK